MRNWNYAFILKCIAAIIIIAAIILCVQKCPGEKPTVLNIDSLQVKVIEANKETAKADTNQKKQAKSYHKKKAKILADTTHSEETKEVVKEVFAYCDTVRVADSTMIEAQRHELALLYLFNYNLLKQHSKDSLTIIDTVSHYKKRVRRLQWDKAGIIALWLGREIGGVMIKKD